MPKALITGITGQDGSYLAEYLLEKGYDVVGITSGRTNKHNIAASEERLTLLEGDITDSVFVQRVVEQEHPTEIYNLASVSSVLHPWDDVPGIIRATALAPSYILDAIKSTNTEIRFFQASSAEMFGEVQTSPQTEQTPIAPRNPYGIAKAFAHHLVGAYRRDQGIHAVSGILFNHESPRRAPHFVTRKITDTLARIACGEDTVLALGNLDTKRDWGFAGDYVRAMHLALNAPAADDYVLSSGASHSIREAVEVAAGELGMNISWRGEGVAETGVLPDGRTVVAVSESFYRPNEIALRRGDSARAREVLGWSPHVSFEELIRMMVRADLASHKAQQDTTLTS